MLHWKKCEQWYVLVIQKGRNLQGLFVECCNKYGESCLNASKIYEGTDRFKNGRFLSVIHNRKKASVSKNNDNIQAGNQTIHGNQRIDIDEIPSELNINHGSGISIIHNLQIF